MTKEEFLTKLKSNVNAKDLSLISYYSELISDRVEGGEKEEDVVAGFDIKKILKDIDNESAKKELSEKSKQQKKSKTLVVVLALCSAPVTLPLGIAFAVIIITFFAIAASFVAAGIGGVLWLVASAVYSLDNGKSIQYILLSSGIGLSVLGVLGILGIYFFKAFKLFYDAITVHFFKLSKKRAKEAE